MKQNKKILVAHEAVLCLSLPCVMTPAAWAHDKGKQEHPQPCAVRGGESGSWLWVKGALCPSKQKSSKKKNVNIMIQAGETQGYPIVPL